MAIKCNTKRGGAQSYYSCSTKWFDPSEVLKKCDMTYTRNEIVDNATWNWLKEKFCDENALIEALHNQQSKREELSKPQGDSLNTVNNLLAEKQIEMVKILDVYLTGDFPAEWLAERKNRIDNEIKGFKAQQRRLQTILDEEELSEERIKTILELAYMYGAGYLKQKRISRNVNGLLRR